MKPGEGEGGQLRPHDPDAVALGRPLVGRQRAQHAAGAAVAQTVQRNEDQDEDAQAQLEHRRLRRDGEPEEVGGPELVLGDPGELLAHQQVAGGGEAEGQRGDGGEHAVEPQRRDADHDGHDRGGGTGQQQGEAQVPVPVEQGHRADGGADRGEGHLAQADLPRPPGEHDNRAADDGQHDESRTPDQLTGPIHSGSVQTAAKATSAAIGVPTRTSVRSRSAVGQVAHAAGQGQRGLDLAVGPVRQELAHDDGGEHDTGQDGQPERGVGGIVPGHALFEDAERNGGGGDDRQAR